MKPGERTFDLTANQISLPDKLEPVQIVPSQVRLAFDVRARRRVPVRPRWVGTFADGYRVRQVETDPASVEVIGPRKEVEEIESAVTDPIDITGLIDRTVVLRHAYVSDPLIQVVDPHPIRITVIMERAPASPGASQAR
jgi:YbbR domain-containing protein